MIDIKGKRKTIEVADITPQEEWWEKNLLEAYTEIETLKQQRDDLLEACKEAQKLFGFIAENYKSAPHFPNAERLVDAAIAKCEA